MRCGRRRLASLIYSGATRNAYQYRPTSLSAESEVASDASVLLLRYSAASHSVLACKSAAISYVKLGKTRTTIISADYRAIAIELNR